MLSKAAEARARADEVRNASKSAPARAADVVSVACHKTKQQVHRIDDSSDDSPALPTRRKEHACAGEGVIADTYSDDAAADGPQHDLLHCSPAWADQDATPHLGPKAPERSAKAQRTGLVLPAVPAVTPRTAPASGKAHAASARRDAEKLSPRAPAALPHEAVGAQAHRHRPARTPTPPLATTPRREHASPSRRTPDAPGSGTSCTQMEFDKLQRDLSTLQKAAESRSEELESLRRQLEAAHGQAQRDAHAAASACGERDTLRRQVLPHMCNTTRLYLTRRSSLVRVQGRLRKATSAQTALNCLLT